MSEHTCPGYLSDPPDIQRALDEGGYWIGCEHPERPADLHMVTIGDCRGCEIAGEMAQRTGVPKISETTEDGILAQIHARSGEQ